MQNIRKLSFLARLYHDIFKPKRYWPVQVMLGIDYNNKPAVVFGLNSFGPITLAEAEAQVYSLNENAIADPAVVSVNPGYQLVYRPFKNSGPEEQTGLYVLGEGYTNLVSGQPEPNQLQRVFPRQSEEAYKALDSVMRFAAQAVVIGMTLRGLTNSFDPQSKDDTDREAA